ncbi:MAG: hypothetical protein FWG32_07720, partial [Oscillospiraceae bacterium]|nr:hypothetical protein [Oscillospiraceae bacterium]
MNYLAMLLPVITVVLIFSFFFEYFFALKEPDGAVSALGAAAQTGSLKLNGRDILLLLAIMLIYGAAAFWGLGDKTAPQSF